MANAFPSQQRWSRTPYRSPAAGEGLGLTITVGFSDLDMSQGERKSCRLPSDSVLHHQPTTVMNRRVIRQILMALGFFAAITLLFVLIAQFG